MIVFVEERKIVVDSYKRKFEKAGESLVRFSAADLAMWISSSNAEDLVTVEAVIIGECTNPQDIIDTIRGRLEAPVVAMLDNRSLEKLITLYRKGVDDVVVKPVHFDELLVRIAAIKKRSISLSERGVKNQITIYFDGRDPELAGEQIVLPRRERRILEYLASINGRRATKGQIFGAIYGVFDDKIEESVIESHISKLRKKLRTFIGSDPIDSRRYLGYRLNPDQISIGKYSPMVLAS